MVRQVKLGLIILGYARFNFFFAADVCMSIYLIRLYIDDELFKTLEI